jgi:hypothetical protein
MKRPRLFGLVFAATCTVACSESRPLSPPGDGGTPQDAATADAATADAATADTPTADAGGQPARCPSGASVVHHSLTPPPSTPPLGALDLPGLHPNTIIVPAENGVANSMRFDLCQEAGGLALHAILLRDLAQGVATRFVLDGSITAPVTAFLDIPEGRAFEVRIPRTAAVVEGLDEALGGNLRALRIRLLGDKGLLVVGHTGFLAIARGDVTTTSIEYSSLYVLVGGLGPGNVFAGLRCPLGQMPLETSFLLDTALFELEACTFLGGGITTGYRINRLTVQDSNPGLQEAHRRRFEFTTEDEVKAVMTYRWNHHNACDSFHLALDHADYAASAAPAAGCGPQVPNAPARRIDEPSESPVLYRIRYYGGTWRDGSIGGCSHYLHCK